MRQWAWALIVTAVMSSASVLCAQVRSAFELLDDEPENVYLPPGPPRPDQLFNQGGVNFSLDVSYLSNYIYRGIDQTTPPLNAEKALQFDSRLEFNLGKFPHPFIGLFANVFNSDPISRFEEIRPYAGLIWTIRPLTISGGYNDYIFPNREKTRDTQEVWAQVSVDDSAFWHTERPFLTPYIYGAYDFRRYSGFYLEAGIKHDLPIGETGAVLTFAGDFGYVAHDVYFRAAGPLGKATGFQHYDVGVIGTYNLNTPFNFPRRYGQLDLRGYLFYTGPVDTALRADSQLWGGVGLHFSY